MVLGAPPNPGRQRSCWARLRMLLTRLAVAMARGHGFGAFPTAAASRGPRVLLPVEVLQLSVYLESARCQRLPLFRISH